MTYSNDYSGEITISPPLNAPEIRRFTALHDLSDSFDAHLRINRDESTRVEGESVLIFITETADAILGPDESCNGYEVQKQIQALVDLYPDREFTGFIQVDWDQGFGDPPSRYVLRDRRVVEVKPQVVWPDEDDPALAEARDLAKLALGILGQMPTCLGDFHPDLEDERLPVWAGGEAETWQRGGE